MELVADDTQRIIADTLGRLLDDANGFEKRRERLAGATPDRMVLWPPLVESGMIGALFPERTGGFGGSARDAAVILYEIGRTLTVEPLVGVFVCGRILATAGTPEADTLIAATIAGERLPVFAHVQGFDPFAVAGVSARASEQGYRLSGVKAVVRHTDIADVFVVTATLDGESAAFLVDRAAAGVAVAEHRLIDAAGGGRLMLADAPATLLLRGAAAQAAIRDAVEHGVVALAAETAGIIDALNMQTRDYLVTRRQFGVPIARFQALQHRAADMHIAAEEVRATLADLLPAMSHGEDDARSAGVSALKLAADRAGRLIAHEAVQLHGGMGVSEELPISHYLRRLVAIRAEFGGEDFHLDRVAALAPGGLERHEPEATRAFRAEVRDFVRAELPADLSRKSALGLRLDRDDYRRWERILRGKGWYAAAWPVEHGGAGWDLGRQLTFAQEAALNDAPMIIPYGVSMLGPVLYTFGTEEQRARYLPGILGSETWWCQGYSEPNAGSDLASLKTFAELDGDEYVVNGTKMWTTEAQWADKMHCLVRTRREGKPQEGISFLLIDMDSPGVTVRPIGTLDGQHHVNQTFLDNVRVPVENLVGGEGRGWAIAKFLLANERVAIADTGTKLRLLRRLREMLAAAEASATPSAVVERMRARLTDLDVQLSALVALERHYVEEWAAGAPRDGPQASVLKIRGTEILQAMADLALAIQGPMAALHDPADLHKSPEIDFTAEDHASFVANEYLYARCCSIYGGTNEIQRNIIAKAIGVA